MPSLGHTLKTNPRSVVWTVS